MNTSIFGNNYHSTDTLGEGTFGSVVTVYNDDGDMYAMKIFNRFNDNDSDDSGYDTDDTDESLIDDSLDLGTLREISSLAMFSDNFTKVNKNFYYPNLIKIIDITYNNNGEICMIMPKMRSDLVEVIKDDILDMNSKIKIAYRLLCALTFYHKNNVIHRDIKTDNILLDDALKPYIADFSLAKIFGDEENESGHTHTGEVGTEVFKAPEIYNGEQYDKKSDVYSLGVVFIEMFNGILKIEKDKHSLIYMENILKKLSNKPLPNLLKRMLDSNPSTRISAEDALNVPLFEKFKKPKIEKILNKSLNVRNPSKRDISKKQKKKLDIVLKDDVHKKWVVLKYKNPLTKTATRYYIEKTKNEIPLIYCLLLAGKLYETELLSITDIIDILPEFNHDEYVECEKKIFKMCDFCLFV
jgi:serine/threonine protein kinase